uniref:Uncharacterized protein n=1 Tax=Anguilla anguilla TaxID=7936 RepID=A0A0E9UV80_ANGAN
MPLSLNFGIMNKTFKYLDIVNALSFWQVKPVSRS